MTVPAPLAKLEPDLRDLAMSVLAHVEKVAPGLVRKVKWGNAVLSGKGDVFAVMGTGKGANAHVNLQIFQGSSIADSVDLIEGAGKTMRHIKFRSVEELDRPGVDQIIRAAVLLDEAR
ncbi:MAG: DUF1801 domain-containing protein [Hyphomicrobiaceae bacterium]|nr:DUF1801 domain-containing protein [Hyphomicrobiaceae bacterium]